jgi:hypothetical protein
MPSSAWNAETATTEFAGILDRKAYFVRIQCDTGSSNPLAVRVQNKIQNIHDDDQSVTIAAGASQQFIATKGNPITEIFVAGVGGNATYSGTVVATAN